MKLSSILRLSSLFAIGSVKAVDFVDCVGGMSSGQTCYAACNDGVDCCGPSNACKGFTGKVAKDGSCMGQEGS